MPKTKMKFSPVPGDTPREIYKPLARHIISAPKEVTAMTEDEVRDAHRILKSRGFQCRNETEDWFNLHERKHFTRKSIRDNSAKWLRDRLEEKVPDGEFWFYSYSTPTEAKFQLRTSQYELSGCRPIPKPTVP